MTRDGGRAVNITKKSIGTQFPFVGDIIRPDGVTLHSVTWTGGGSHCLSGCGLDLVADWPDADPLPDADGVRPAPSGPVVEETEPEQNTLLFEVEAMWGDGPTSVVRYVEAVNMREALEVVPPECDVLRINLLGGLYKPARQIGEAMEGK